MKKKYRIANPVRFFVFVLIVVLSLTMAIYTMIGSAASQAATADTYREIEVRDNDTLWTIANEYCDSNSDTREIVYQICEINNINASDIQPGDTLMIPVEA